MFGERRTITFNEEEYKIIVRALMELRNEYIDNEIIKEDINSVIEKMIEVPKKKGLFKSGVEER